MKSIFDRFRKGPDSAKDSSVRAGGANQPSLISRGQPALKGYLKPRPQPEIANDEENTKTVLDILDNPDLELEPQGFNPYNSGSFDRKKDWTPVKKTTR